MNAFGNQVPVGARRADLLVTDRQQHQVQRERPGLAAQLTFQVRHRLAGPRVAVQARVKPRLLAGAVPVMSLFDGGIRLDITSEQVWGTLPSLGPGG